MTTLTVRFRGIFTVVLKDDPNTQKSVRILLPQGMNPRLASGNRSQQIDRHFSFVAVPLGKDKSIPAATVSGALPYQPNMICPMKTDIHPDYKLRPPFGRGFRREMILTEDRIDCGLSDTEGQLYAVYFVPQHEIRFEGLSRNSSRGGMTWNDDTIDLTVMGKGGPRPSSKSMQWNPDLREFAPAIDLRPELLDGRIDHDTACAAYADFMAGKIVPFHNDAMVGDAHVHSWRFMHSASAAREMADGVEVILPVDGELKAVLRNRETDEVLTVPIDPANGIVLVGNETIGDLLRYETISSCSDPAYEFELNYSLCEGEMPPRPVPVCAEPDDDDHRDPPGLACSKAMTVRIPKRTAAASSARDSVVRKSARIGGPIGFAVHLGVNDYNHNGPTFSRGDLRSAILDADGFNGLSKIRGFTEYSKGGVLRDAAVTNLTIVDAITEAKSILQAGDYFLVSFNGFGFNVGGKQGWQLYRGYLGFPALFQLVSALPDDVRVLIVSAACYSGTLEESHDLEDVVFRELPQKTQLDLWSQRARKAFDSPDYDLLTVGDVLALEGFEQSNTPVIAHLAACGPTQRTPDGTASAHSPFVKACLDVAAGPQRSFQDFESELRSLLPLTSQPQVDRRPERGSGFPPSYESTGPFLIK